LPGRTHNFLGLGNYFEAARATTMPEFDPAKIQSARLRRFYDYWRAKHREGALPGRADIDPVEFAWALGFVSLYDMLPDGDVRVRVDASKAVEFFGQDLTGTLLSAHPDPAMSTMMVRTLAQIARTRMPIAIRRDFEMHNRDWRYEALIVPFAADGQTVDMLASVLSYEGANG
jgi:hypothetical protein